MQAPVSGAFAFGKDAASGERGAGKGAAALVPASAHSGPERDSAPNREFLLADQSGLTRLVNTAPFITSRNACSVKIAAM